MSTWIDREKLTRSFGCRRVRGELQSYLDGLLEDPRAEQMAQHVANCRRCSREAETYQAIKDSLGRRRSSPDAAVQRLRKFGEALPDQPGESLRAQGTPQG